MKNNLFKKIMKDKETRRTKLAALSFAEKIAILIELQKMAEVVAVMAGKKSHSHWESGPKA